MVGIGIDFGTTNSVLAYYDGRKATPLLNELQQPHPSVIWLHGDRVTVGQEAKANFNTYVGREGHQFIRSIKRKIDPDAEIDGPGRPLPTWQAASYIFKHLRDQAQRHLPEVRECVVTVPVYFDGRRRAAIRRAAQEAGLFVKTFVHEPFAAFVGFLEAQPAHVRDEIRNVLVFDWGGGTLDITLVSAQGGKIYEQGTGGIADRAGDDFDRLLQEHLKQRFMQRHGLSADEVLLSPPDQDRLAFEAERRKIDLSSAMETEVSLTDLFQVRTPAGRRSFSLQERVSRSSFEQLIAPDIRAAEDAVERTLARAGISRDAVDRVLLIGGTSLIPAVVESLRSMFGLSRVVTVPNAPTIIAEGAAIVAYYNWRPYLVYSLGVKLSDDTVYPVFESGFLPLPGADARPVTFYCTDHRDGVGRLVLAEGRRGDAWVTKCVLPIQVDPALRHSRVERVHTQFRFDEDLVLHVEGHGSVKQIRASAQVYDLCYGLRRD